MLDSMKVKPMARRVPWTDMVDLVFVAKDMEGNKFIASPLTLTPLPRDESIDVPTVALEFDAAQQLMDALWDCGLRPTEGIGSAGALAATQAHLKDMRELTFKLLAQEK